MIGVWSGEEQGIFMGILEPFLDACDISIEYEGTRDLAVYSTRIEGGNPPDISGIPNPGLLSRFEEYMVPLGDVIDLEPYSQVWQDLGTVNDTIYGAFFKADGKSLVWYSPPTFEALGYEVPTTWDETLTLMDTMVEETGTPPWSCGIEASDATGWVATDWIQDILLRQQGAEFVEQWAAHEVPWTDPAIKEAFETYYSVCGSDEYAAGGAQGTLNTNFVTSIYLVYRDPAEAYMTHHAFFAASEIKAQFSDLESMTDYNFFVFPEFNADIGAPMQGGADVMAFFNPDNASAVALMNYMFGEQGQRALAETGWGLAPHSAITAEDYPTELQGNLAEAVNEAPSFSFDADDRMPGGLNVDYWQACVDYLSGGDLDQILQNMEERAVEAYD